MPPERPNTAFLKPDRRTSLRTKPTSSGSTSPQFIASGSIRVSAAGFASVTLMANPIQFFDRQVDAFIPVHGCQDSLPAGVPGVEKGRDPAGVELGACASHEPPARRSPSLPRS